jgi:hypothetical protein
MISLRFALVASIVFAWGLAIVPRNGMSATPLIADKADAVVTLRNVTANENEVSGEVVNNSKDAVRDVEIQILYSWRWNNEFHPGSDDPGRAAYQTINSEIAPGQSTRFSYKPSPPVAQRKDGHYDYIVKVVSFSQVYRGSSTAR